MLCLVYFENFNAQFLLFLFLLFCFYRSLCLGRQFCDVRKLTVVKLIFVSLYPPDSLEWTTLSVCICMHWNRNEAINNQEVTNYCYPTTKLRSKKEWQMMIFSPTFTACFLSLFFLSFSLLHMYWQLANLMPTGTSSLLYFSFVCLFPSFIIIILRTKVLTRSAIT